MPILPNNLSTTVDKDTNHTPISTKPDPPTTILFTPNSPDENHCYGPTLISIHLYDPV